RLAAEGTAHGSPVGWWPRSDLNDPLLPAGSTADSAYRQRRSAVLPTSGGPGVGVLSLARAVAVREGEAISLPSDLTRRRRALPLRRVQRRRASGSPGPLRPMRDDGPVDTRSAALLEPRLVGDVEGTFIVRDYQRGYRWGPDEVRRLLDDINGAGDQD